MAPSIFAARPLEEARPSPPPKSKFKSFSAFLSNPFGSSSTNQSPQKHSHVVPSAPIPYQPSIKADISLTNFAVTSSPFKVYINDGLPSSTTASSGRGPLGGVSAGSGVAGLPASHYPLVALASSLEAPSSADKPVWKEMPTLASAIHIADTDPPTSTTFGPSQPLPRANAQPQPAVPVASDARTGRLPRSASSTSSIFEAYRNRRSLRRSSSRSSTKQDGKESETEQSAHPSGRPRRMSRRLSFDSILHPFANTSRRKDRNLSQEPENEARRWSNADQPGGPAPPAAQREFPAESARAARLVMPPTRSLRNKFSTQPKTGAGLMAAARADVAARRRIHEYDDMGNGRIMPRRKDEDGRTGSLGAAAGQGVLKRMEAERLRALGLPNHPLAAPVSRPLPTPPSAPPAPALVVASVAPVANVAAISTLESLPDIAIRRSSMLAQTSSPAPMQDVASPVYQPKPTSQTPGNPLASLALPNASRATLLLSPARDDMSILDPSRSPFPISISIDTLGSPFPAEAIDGERTGNDDTAQVIAMDGDSSGEESEGNVARRQQSLSEIKDAFTRMRDLSGLDVSSQGGSQPSSRRASHADGPNVDAEAFRGPEPADSTVRAKIPSRPSLDLGGLHSGLKAVNAQNCHLNDCGPSSKLSQATLRPASEDPTDGSQAVTCSSSTSSDMMTAQSSMTYDADIDGELSRAQSGRSFHTAQEDSLTGLSTVHKGLPRSRSKSTHDLASLASGKNLVEQMEKSQGEGWWSVNRQRVIGRRASNIESLRRTFDREDDKRLEVLERLAKTSQITNRSRFMDPPSPGQDFDVSMTPDRPGHADTRPGSAFEIRRDLPRTLNPQRSMRHMDDWRPSSVQNRPRAVFHGPRPSLVAGSTWGRERRGSQLAEDTPTRPSSRRPGQFATSKISPDIARRASCLTRRIDGGSVEDFSPSRRRASTAVLEEKLELLKQKHALELDAILGALSSGRTEIGALKEEIGGLRRSLSETGTERDGLREKVRVLEARIEELSARSGREGVLTRGRSSSLVSTLLPDLAVPDASLVINASPLDGPCSNADADDLELEDGADEFGRKLLITGGAEIKALRSRRSFVRDSTLFDTSYGSLIEDEEDSEAGQNWTLRLRSADEAHLNDL